MLINFWEVLCISLLLTSNIVSAGLSIFIGLIEGASLNRGRGRDFLKHLEQSDILIMVVDVMGFQLVASFKEQFR